MSPLSIRFCYLAFTYCFQRQREVCKLEEELHSTRETLEAEIRRLKLDLQEMNEKEKQRTNEGTATQKQLIEANAEVCILCLNHYEIVNEL